MYKHIDGYKINLLLKVWLWQREYIAIVNKIFMFVFSSWLASLVHILLIRDVSNVSFTKFWLCYKKFRVSLDFPIEE